MTAAEQAGGRSGSCLQERVFVRPSNAPQLDEMMRCRSIHSNEAMGHRGTGAQGHRGTGPLISYLQLHLRHQGSSSVHTARASSWHHPLLGTVGALGTLSGSDVCKHPGILWCVGGSSGLRMPTCVPLCACQRACRLACLASVFVGLPFGELRFKQTLVCWIGNELLVVDCAHILQCHHNAVFASEPLVRIAGLGKHVAPPDNVGPVEGQYASRDQEQRLHQVYDEPIPVD